MNLFRAQMYRHTACRIHTCTCRQRATCLCAGCVAGVGPGGVEMMPTEFERHGGCGSFKKWKKSILVCVNACCACAC